MNPLVYGLLLWRSKYTPSSRLSLKTCTAGEDSLLPSARQRLESTQLPIVNVSPPLLQRAVCYTNWPKATKIQCVAVYQNAGSETCWPLHYLLSSYQHSKDARLENSWFPLSVHRSLGYRAFQLSTSISRLFHIVIYNYVHICASACGFITVSVVLMGGKRRALDPLGLQSQGGRSCPVWQLGAKFWSFAKAVNFNP